MNTPTSYIKKHPILATILLSAMGYVLVIGTLSFRFLNPLYPDLSRSTVNLLSHVIAANNFCTTVLLIMGWLKIRQGDTRSHPKYMTAGFVLILVFLVLYLLKAGGGGRKEFVGPDLPKRIYLSLLLIHILLSIFSMPLVLHTFLLGITRSVSDVPRTAHASIGQWAAGMWIISLILGLIAYVFLNHIYSYEFVPVT